MNNVLRYELDEYGKVGITLGEFNSLAEMDLFMHKFKDSNSQYIELEKHNLLCVMLPFLSFSILIQPSATKNPNI